MPRNWDGRLYFHELKGKDPKWLQTIQVGHWEGAAGLLDPTHKQQLQATHWKWRNPATNKGTAVASHWFCWNRFVAMVETGADPGCGNGSPVPVPQPHQNRVLWTKHNPVGPDYQLVEAAGSALGFVAQEATMGSDGFVSWRDTDNAPLWVVKELMQLGNLLPS